MTAAFGIIAFVFGFGSMARAQIVVWTCDAYPVYYLGTNTCQGADGASYTYNAADANSFGICFSDATQASTSSEANGSALDFTGGSWAYADGFLVGSGSSPTGIGATAIGVAWGDGYDEEVSSAEAEVDCGGTTYSFDDDFGGSTYAFAYGDIVAGG